MVVAGISIAALVLGAAGVLGVILSLAVPRVFGASGGLGVSGITDAVHALVAILATSATDVSVSRVPLISWVLLLPWVS